MSDNSFTFEDILNEALQGKSVDGDAANRVKLTGTHRMRAVFANGDKLTAKGDHKVGVKWEVVGGPQEGEVEWQNIYFTAKTKKRAGQMLFSLGFTPEYLSGLAQRTDFASGLLELADDMVGIEATLKLTPSGDFVEFEVLELHGGPGVENTQPALATSAPGIAANTSAPLTQTVVTYPEAEAAKVTVPGGFIPQV